MNFKKSYFYLVVFTLFTLVSCDLHLDNEDSLQPSRSLEQSDKLIMSSECLEHNADNTYSVTQSLNSKEDRYCPGQINTRKLRHFDYTVYPDQTTCLSEANVYFAAYVYAYNNSPSSSYMINKLNFEWAVITCGGCGYLIKLTSVEYIVPVGIINDSEDPCGSTPEV